MKLVRFAAATMVLSQLIMPVMADQTTTLTTEQIEALQKEADKIKTVEDFIQTYFSTKEEKTDEQGQPLDPVYTTYVFSQLNDQQYESVLQAEQVFSYLPEDLQTQIQDWFKAYTEANPEDENQPFVHELSDWFTRASEIKTEVEKKKAEEEQKEKEKQALETTEEKSEPEVVAPKRVRRALPSEPVESSETESQPITEETTTTTTTPETTESAETETTTPTTTISVPRESTETNFINAYALNEAGVAYTDVNSANYRKILSGLNTWTSLSKSQKANINLSLKNQGGLTYSQMLSYAQSYQYGRKPLSVQTSLKDDAPMYRLMVGGSLVGFLFASAQIKRKDA